MSSTIVFDQYQRYHFIEHVISVLSKNRDCHILEVGAFGSPLKQLLPNHRIVELDPDPKEFQVDVRATGLHLPFCDQAFDIVVSTDVLEHMDSTDRIPFIKELTRVTSDCLILGFPHADPLNTEADKVFLEFIRNYSGLDFDFLKEHLKFGLPDLNEMHRQVKSLLPEVLEVKNANVHSWTLLQLGNFILLQHPELQEMQTLLNDFFNRSMEASSHRPPNYRTFLVGSLRGFTSDAKVKIEEGNTISKSGSAEEFAAESFALISASQAAIRYKNDELALQKSRLEAQEQRLKEQEFEIQNLRESLQNQQVAIQNLQHTVDEYAAAKQTLQDYLDLFLHHPAYKIYKFLKKSLLSVRTPRS